MRMQLLFFPNQWGKAARITDDREIYRMFNTRPPSDERQPRSAE